MTLNPAQHWRYRWTKTTNPTNISISMLHKPDLHYKCQPMEQLVSMVRSLTETQVQSLPLLSWKDPAYNNTTSVKGVGQTCF